MKFELKDGKLSQSVPQQEQPKPQSSVIAPKNPFYEEIRKQESAPMMQPSASTMQHAAAMQQQAATQAQMQAMAQAQMQAQMQQEELARQEIIRQQVLQQQMVMQQQQAAMMQAQSQVPIVAKLTIFLTEGQALEPISIPMDKVEEATTNLDQAIMSQSVYKYALTAINGLYIKRYTIE